MSADAWTVVLAAGAGRRLASVTGDVPKQFWRGRSGESLLGDTRARFAEISDASRTVVIVDRRHTPHLEQQANGWRDETIVLQPGDRGTAAGVLLALTPVLDRAPDAVVAVTPSDHGVRDVKRFRECVLEAVSQAHAGAGPVLFGVEPTRAHEDYGWITPGGSPTGGRMRSVTAFVEKPARDVAAQLLESGAVWNTMIVVAKAAAIRSLYAEHLPDLATTFDRFRRIHPDDRAGWLADAYRTLPSYDFSRDVLTPARNLWTYVLPASIGWTDLGTPDRLREWQSCHARTRAVPSAAPAA
jgi:mannose-1-phosphate guanylyltransferase